MTVDRRPIQSVDWLTIAALAFVMMPLMTMWHEIGGHAATCVALGGRVTAIGAFYVNCEGLPRLQEIMVSCAGVTANILLAIITYLAWKRARADWPRLILWLLFVSQAFVAAGYFAFSGISGVGDLAPTTGGELGLMPHAIVIRILEVTLGAASYVLLVKLGIRMLTAMLGQSSETALSRRRIAHVFYLTAGLGAVAVGLANPVGLFILLASAAASSFGGLAGFISIGYASPKAGEQLKPFVIRRTSALLIAGPLVLAGFALILGPTIHP